MYYIPRILLHFSFLFEFIYKDVFISIFRILNITTLYYNFLEIENEKLKYHH